MQSDLQGSYNGISKHHFKFYTTKSGRLAVGIKERIQKLDAFVSVRNGRYLSIVPEVTIDELIMYRKDDEKPYPDMEAAIYLNEVIHTSELEFDLNELKASYMDADFVIVAKKAGVQLYLVAEEDLIQTVDLRDCKITITNNCKGLQLSVSHAENNAIPIVLLSSCVSRRMMTRKQNSDYRKLFHVVLEHFWPSMFSMVSDKIEIPQGWFEEWEEREKPAVNREFNKSLFEELKKLKFDYLILDLFTDAVHGPRMIEEGKFIGYQGYARNIYSEYLLLDSERYYLQTNYYFEQWKKVADSFMEQLVKCIPASKIVLVKGGFAEYYWNERHERVPYKGSKLSGSNLTTESLAARGELWNRMNTYLISKYPEMLVLETKQYEYCGNYADQASIAPYHYEQNMYRSQLAELAKLILWDKINCRDI